MRALFGTISSGDPLSTDLGSQPLAARLAGSAISESLGDDLADWARLAGTCPDVVSRMNMLQYHRCGLFSPTPFDGYDSIVIQGFLGTTPMKFVIGMGIRNGTNWVSTNGVTANLMFSTEGPFGDSPLAYSHQCRPHLCATEAWARRGTPCHGWPASSGPTPPWGRPGAARG